MKQIGKASAVTTEEGYIAVVEGGAKSGQKRVDMNFTENAARHGADPELLATESLYDPRTLDSNAPVTTEDAYDPRTLEGLAPGESMPAIPSRPSLRTPDTTAIDRSKQYAHGSINRKDAEARLEGKPSGTFLVRESPSVDGFVISVCTSPGKYAHVKVTRRDDGLATSDRVFRTLPDLIAFYQQHSIHSGFPLTAPCPKP
eukprot:TRINITY_DN10228_c0_g1_i6.p1 TRINITY_DN10228_c0_g1~~TRINITY_DN10228_c0_g1_i6.p1  ORF type:complete len:201 (+),score=22.52 TRINITY_DN10228_c0_g1_i6:56-658(+)